MEMRLAISRAGVSNSANAMVHERAYVYDLDGRVKS
jgi:hypothetical protein